MPKARLKGSEEQRIPEMQPSQQEDDMDLMIKGKVLEFRHYTPGDVAVMLGVATTTVKGWMPDAGVVGEIISNGQVILDRHEVKRMEEYCLERQQDNPRVGQRNSHYQAVVVTPPPPDAPQPRRGRPVRRSPL